MNTMKKNGGFTLVELIIVIAILAILSTGAIAGYSAYIKSANNAAVEAVLSDISTSAVLANAKAGGITTITVKESTTTNKLEVVVTVSSTSVDEDFPKLFTSSLKAISASDDTDNVGNTYTCTVNMPDAWKNSGYSGKIATWSANAWSDGTTGETTTTTQG